MNNKKAQSAIEFFIIAGAVFFFIIGLMNVFYEKISIENKEKRNEEFYQLALDLQNEIEIAAQASDGYRREFTLPQTIANKEYEIQMDQTSIYIKALDSSVALSLQSQNATGQFNEGALNVIRKFNNTVFIN